VTTAPSRLPRVLRVMPLLCAEGGEEKPKVSLVATKSGRPTETHASFLIAGGLSSETTLRRTGGKAKVYTKHQELKQAGK